MEILSNKLIDKFSIFNYNLTEITIEKKNRQGSFLYGSGGVF